MARFLLCAFLLASAAGCMRQKMVITSEPSGARVVVNDEFVGTTPYEMDLMHIGVFRIRLEQDGYYPMNVKEPYPAKPHQKIPLDLVAHAGPWTVREEREFHYIMQPIERPDDIDGIIARAQEMRDQTTPLIQERREYSERRTPIEWPILPRVRPLPDESPRHTEDKPTPPTEPTTQEDKEASPAPVRETPVGTPIDMDAIGGDFFDERP